jgi:predicted DNA-binding ribbon-helix-helix protein
MQPQIAVPDALTPLDASKKPPSSTLVSRNVTISGHRTSVRLEPEMWSGLSEICRRERASLHEICTAVSMRKTDNTSLTAAIRVFVMAYFRSASTEDGHTKAGHGYGMAMGMSSQVQNQNVMAPQASSQQRMAPPSPFMIGARINGGSKTGTR